MKMLLPLLLLCFASIAHAEQTQGTLLLLHSDDLEKRKSTEKWILREDSGKSTEIEFPAGERHQSGRRVKVNGDRQGNKFKVRQTTVIGAAPTTSAPILHSYGATGTQTALFILIRFSDNGAWAPTQADIRNGPATDVTNFLRLASFGQLNMAITVTPWYTSSGSSNGCDMTTIQNAAQVAATAGGYVLANYRFLVYVFPPLACGGWTGSAYVGTSGAWINGVFGSPTYEHELGHNLGLLHAGGVSSGCLISALGACTTVQEYGDPYDAMAASAGQYATAQKVILGWTSAVATYGGTGTVSYVLSAVDVAPFGTGLAGVKVPTALTTRTYWLEYRKSGGVQVRVAAPFERVVGSDDTELLLRAGGGSSDAIPVGGSFTDAANKLVFTVLSADGANATVSVGAPSGSPPSPPAPPAPQGCGSCPCSC